ncbi:MAG: hypothetical protein A2Y62_03625 [Candidatus Fischerbacteria bacterium RBG_13_37_8]|uniref:Anaphase-promoting complex subunit 4 WD40 domain-containing protein n=1 Tax=Candidatus Fischerbacteria bacterium RBG_13_37_8 TaxID=1817863 RepID=A0A1F5V804_9BACT|nr:MAG: hypothetical protein A2Y62_03625 [Candidatus Fischerbacteria bacterium RBG_13_37_8]
MDNQGSTVVRLTYQKKEPQLWRASIDKEFIPIRSNSKRSQNQKACPQLTRISLSMNGEIAVLANSKGCIEIYRTTDLEHLITFNSQMTSLCDIASSPHGNYLAVRGDLYPQSNRLEIYKIK